jgi:hypothetical protein
MASAKKAMLPNVGPSHPAMHRVIRLITELEGETVFKQYDRGRTGSLTFFCRIMLISAGRIPVTYYVDNAALEDSLNLSGAHGVDRPKNCIF